MNRGGAIGALALLATLFAAPPARADDTTCDATNLLEHARLVRWMETSNATALLTDGAVVPEGTPATSQAVGFTSLASSLTFDLGAPATIGAVTLQGDADVAFTLLVSPDAQSWRKVTIGPVPGGGLRTRSSAIDPIEGRYVRFGDPSAPSAHATELQLRCRLPEALPLRVLERDPSPPPPLARDTLRARAWTAITGVPVLLPGQALAMKLALAIAAALLLAVRAARLARARDALLVLVATASLTGYFNWGAYRFPNYAHTHELFHYVVGAKYFRELGYTGLYDCAEAVDAEQGLHARAVARPVRDLTDNAMGDGEAALARGEVCKRRFTPARWGSVAHDVGWFRDHMTPEGWDRVLRDHGFNPSPAWTMLGAPIANLRPASRGFVGYADDLTGGVLAAIDPALVALGFVAVAWAFGWRTACVAAIVFGCNPLADFTWTGGAYLRQDWLAAVLVGIACLKKERFALGGAAIGYAALLRVFPGVLFFGVTLRIVWVAVEQRRLDRDLARVLAGGALAAAVVVPLSSAVAGGFGAWGAFVHNTAKLATSPSVNLVGLKSFLSFRPWTRADLLFDPSARDPFAAVIAARKANFVHASPVFVAVLGGFATLFVRAVRRSRDAWVLACLGVAAIPMGVELSCYYTSFLVAAALLVGARPWIGPMLAAACAAFLALQRVLDNDVLYAAASVALVAVALGIAWACGEPARVGVAIFPPPSPMRWRALSPVIAIGVVVAVLVAKMHGDEPMEADAACEARWETLDAAVRARDEARPVLAEATGDEAILARWAASLRLSRDDFEDPAKVAAYEAAHPIEAADDALARGRDAYDAAVARFNLALTRAGVPVVDRATGDVFRPRVALARRP